MASVPENHFGEEIAARYDADDAAVSTPAATRPIVDLLADLAAGGPALEFAIGTGRIALPLAARGIEVRGIDLSEAMVARLRAKPGGEAIEVAIGDIATTRFGGDHRLVYLVYNTINNLTTQDAQVACFANAAAHLAPGGHFVIEVGVPLLRSLPPGQNLHAHHIGDDRWDIDEYRFATQDFVSHHYSVRDGELVRNSIPFRYVWPEELDLMARMAGLTLHARWADWDRSPFGDESTSHISVWRRPG